MLHEKPFICILNGFCDNVIFYISSIDIIIFKASVSAGDFRFSHITFYLHKVIGTGNFKQCFRNISSVNIIYDILNTVIPGAVKFDLFILYIFKRNIRMGKSQLLHKGTDIIAFCGIRFQKFISGRCIIKQISYKKCCSVRCPHLFEDTLFSTFDHIAAATDRRWGFCNQFHL